MIPSHSPILKLEELVAFPREDYVTRLKELFRTTFNIDPNEISLPLRAPLITQNVGLVLCLALIGFTLAIAIPFHQRIPYSHMIDKQEPSGVWRLIDRGNRPR